MADIFTTLQVCDDRHIHNFAGLLRPTYSRPFRFATAGIFTTLQVCSDQLNHDLAGLLRLTYSRPCRFSYGRHILDFAGLLRPTLSRPRRLAGLRWPTYSWLNRVDTTEVFLLSKGYKGRYFISCRTFRGPTYMYSSSSPGWLFHTLPV